VRMMMQDDLLTVGENIFGIAHHRDPSRLAQMHHVTSGNHNHLRARFQVRFQA
jgi:hypothetical protein